MSRHHPYGGYDGQSQPQRRGNVQGPGPDRSFRHESGRGGGGGGGRARGGGRGGPPSSSRGAYGGGGGGGAPQQQYGSANSNANGNGNSGYDAYGAQQHEQTQYSTEYGQDSGAYDAAPYSYDDGSSSRGSAPPPPSGPRRRPPRERDDQVHETLIEDRINRERPCRTLFIRNIKYETSSDHVRGKFEEHGEIKSFYDLVGSRGMVFVTFFDLRAAERARERLQGTEIAGRPIDVHYSLPRADEQNGRCDRDKNQGTLHIVLRNSHSGAPLDEGEVRRKLQQFGDIKSVRPGDGPMDKYVEMYDTRACENAHDKLRDQALQDGEIDVQFAWDVPEQPVPAGASGGARRFDSPRGGGAEGGFRGGGGRGRGGARGGRTGGGGGGGGYGGGGGGGGGGRDERDFGGHDDWAPPPQQQQQQQQQSYGRGPPPQPPQQPMYGAAPVQVQQQQAYAPPPMQDDRLEQAKKVQQLLAALKNPHSPTASPAPPPPAPPQQQQQQFYQQPPPVAAAPPAPAYGGGYTPYAPQAPQPPPNASFSNILAMLQNQAQQQQQQQPAFAPPPPAPAQIDPGAYLSYALKPAAPPPPMPPQPVPQGTPGAGANTAALQNLMALIAQKKS